MRIAIVTDCWLPELNGIVVTLEATVRELLVAGHEVLMVTPDLFPAVRLPYGDQLVLPWLPRFHRRLTDFAPDTVHAATQGMLGLSARYWCRYTGTHFTTAFHTRFPEYASIRFGIPKRLLYRYAHWFHGHTAPVMVPSRALADELISRGFGRPQIWQRGVDTIRFRPRPRTWTKYERPIHLYVGRVVAEKNIDAFMRLQVHGTRIVVGDGQLLAAARSAHPDVVFLGALRGEELAVCYSEADVFVFPSLLDTFGLVVLEALACGTPVAAFAVPHLVETFGHIASVSLADDLAVAVDRALTISRECCREAAERFSWGDCTRQFVSIIESDRLRHG